MPEDPRSFIARHVLAVTDSRVSPQLAADVAGTLGDRHEPVAAEWLRRWHPARAAVSVPACRCTAGRCGVCN
jgi:hypothetical protein